MYDSATLVAAFGRGLLLGAGLIIAIGAQNAYILKQGLLRQHVLPLVLFCAVSDAILIVAGAAGMGSLVASNPMITRFAAIGGGLFLAGYGLKSAVNAVRGTRRQVEHEDAAGDLSRALATAAAFTWLNPHVYLDTVVLLGSVAGQLDFVPRLFFGLGAIVASFAWFFALGYGARLLQPLFARPSSWRVLDAAIAVIMWVIAGSLVAPYL